MTRLLSITALIVALVALGAPSLSLGMGMHLSAPVQVDASSAEPVVAKPCKSLGGKRVLPCHPDLGVMVRVVPFLLPSARYRSWHVVALPLAAARPEAELPPPRPA